MSTSFEHLSALGDLGFLVSGPAALLLVVGCYIYWVGSSPIHARHISVQIR